MELHNEVHIVHVGLHYSGLVYVSSINNVNTQYFYHVCGPYFVQEYNVNLSSSESIDEDAFT